MEEKRKPIDFTTARINRLRGQAMELEMEAQRLEMGRKAQDLSSIINLPKDIFWRRKTNFDQTRAEQANQQSDTKL